MSEYYGDLSLGQTIRIPFNTQKADGTAITLAGTPSVAVYKDGGTTEDTDGVSLSVDFDGKTGSHRAIIDTSVDPTFFSSGSDFVVQLAAGTVDGTSVAGAVLGSFSIANRNRAGFSLANGSILAATFAAGAIDAAALATDAANEIRTGLSTLDAAGVRTAIGLASANLDTQLGAIDDFLDTEVAAIKAKTDLIPAGGFPANFPSMVISAGGLPSINLAQTGLVPRDLSAVADAALTVGDALVSAISEMAGDESVVGTAYTKKTPAGTTTRVFTLDSATEPTSRT
jgi:hypothetical protein